MAPRPSPADPASSGTLSLGAAAGEVPHRIALISEEGYISFGGLAGRVARRVGEMDDLGEFSTPSSPRGLVGSNEVKTLVALYALMEVGVPVALVHPRSPAAERAAWLTECAAELLDIRDAPSAETVALPAPPPDDERCLAIVRTSGSSGRPKGVVLSRRAFAAAAAASADNLGWGDEDRWLLSLPVAHVGGLSVITRCLAGRRTVVVAPPGRFEPQQLGEWLSRWRVSLLSLVPTMLRRLLELPQWRPPAALRAVLLGGAATPPALRARAAQRKVPVLATWGLTEACSQVTTQALETVQRGELGCGRPLGKMKVRVRSGTIEIRGPQLLSAYLPAGTPSPLDAEGWFVTGDTGRLDATGNLHVFGRRDEVIITGGENVHPQEVEAVLLSHPAIVEACVFGVDDDTWGQSVTAVLAASAPLDEVALRDHVKRYLASFKRPRRVLWWQELPKTPAGKVDRRATIHRAQQSFS